MKNEEDLEDLETKDTFTHLHIRFLGVYNIEDKNRHYSKNE